MERIPLTEEPRSKINKKEKLGRVLLLITGIIFGLTLIGLMAGYGGKNRSAVSKTKTRVNEVRPKQINRQEERNKWREKQARMDKIMKSARPEIAKFKNLIMANARINNRKAIDNASIFHLRLVNPFVTDPKLFWPMNDAEFRQLSRFVATQCVFRSIRPLIPK